MERAPAFELQLPREFIVSLVFCVLSFGIALLFAGLFLWQRRQCANVAAEYEQAVVQIADMAQAAAQRDAAEVAALKSGGQKASGRGQRGRSRSGSKRSGADAPARLAASMSRASAKLVGQWLLLAKLFPSQQERELRTRYFVRWLAHAMQKRKSVVAAAVDVVTSRNMQVPLASSASQRALSEPSNSRAPSVVGGPTVAPRRQPVAVYSGPGGVASAPYGNDTPPTHHRPHLAGSGSHPASGGLSPVQSLQRPLQPLPAQRSQGDLARSSSGANLRASSSVSPVGLQRSGSYVVQAPVTARPAGGQAASPPVTTVYSGSFERR